MSKKSKNSKVNKVQNNFKTNNYSHMSFKELLSKLSEENPRGAKILKILLTIFILLFILPIAFYIIAIILSKLVLNGNFNVNNLISMSEVFLGILIIVGIIIFIFRTKKIMKIKSKKIDFINILILIFIALFLIIICIKEFLIPYKFIDYTFYEYIDIDGEKIPTYFLATGNQDTYLSYKQTSYIDGVGNATMALINYREILLAQEEFDNYKTLLLNSGFTRTFSDVEGSRNIYYTEYAYFDEVNNKSMIVELYNRLITYTVINGNYNDYAMYKDDGSHQLEN